MAEPNASPYNDGSSTESEYYFDPEEEEEKKKDVSSWVHEYDARARKEPSHRQNGGDSKEEYNGYLSELEACKEISLPHDSEWSHGLPSGVSYNVAERKTTMARELRKTTPRDEALMTENNVSRAEKEKSGNEVKMTLAVQRSGRGKLSAQFSELEGEGSRRSSRNIAGEPSDAEWELSVDQSQWMSAESLDSPKMSRIERGTLLLQKQSGHRPNEMASSQRSERGYSVSRRRTNRSRSPSIRPNKRSNSPLRCRVEHEIHTEQDASSVVHYSRRSRSKSPFKSRRLEDRQSRSSSRTPCTAPTSFNPRARLHRDYENAMRRDLEKRPVRTYSPSPSRPYQVVRGHFRSKSRSRSTERGRERHDHHASRYESFERRLDQHFSGEKDQRSPSHHASVRTIREAQELNRDTFQHRSREHHHPRSGYNREDLIIPPRDDHRIRNRNNSLVVRLNSRSPRDPRLQGIDQQKNGSRTASSIVNPPKRSPSQTYTRPQDQANATSFRNGKKSGHVVYDVFERQVFKLKLREADIDEKIANGSCDTSDAWHFDNRKRGIAEDRAQLMAQNLERFEKVYASLTVTPFELRRYQNDREFGWRVVQLKRKQASLRGQNNLFMSYETKTEMWRKLDKEREELLAENPGLFHTVMASQNQADRALRQGRKSFAAQAYASQHLAKRAHGDDNTRQDESDSKRPAPAVAESREFTPPANVSRVVAGTALRRTTDDFVRRPDATP